MLGLRMSGLTLEQVLELTAGGLDKGLGSRIGEDPESRTSVGTGALLVANCCDREEADP